MPPKIELTSSTGRIQASCIPCLIDSLTNDHADWIYTTVIDIDSGKPIDILTNGDVSLSWRRDSEHHCAHMRLEFKGVRLWFTSNEHQPAVFEAAKKVMVTKRSEVEYLESLRDRVQIVEVIWTTKRS
jgi:hypothetical protein